MGPFLQLALKRFYRPAKAVENKPFRLAPIRAHLHHIRLNHLKMRLNKTNEYIRWAICLTQRLKYRGIQDFEG